MMYGYYGPHAGTGAWLAMAVVDLGFWVLLVAVIVGVVRSVTARGLHHPGRVTPSEVLAERFARGEIDAEEYVARLRVLEGREP
ncbi:SHOCT domain-containing protein [Nocardioides ultimimeridianus]